MDGFNDLGGNAPAPPVAPVQPAVPAQYAPPVAPAGVPAVPAQYAPPVAPAGVPAVPAQYAPPVAPAGVPPVAPAVSQEQINAEIIARQGAQPVTVPAVIPQEQPPLRLEDYDYDEDRFQQAQIERTVVQKVADATEEQTRLAQQQAAEQRRLEAGAGFSVKVAQANIPGYKEAVGRMAQHIPIQPEVVQALQSVENGPHVAFSLAPHLDKAAELSRMDPVTAAATVGQIAAQMSQVPPVVPTVPAVPVYPQAPAPIAGVGGQPAQARPLESYTMDEIMALKL